MLIVKPTIMKRLLYFNLTISMKFRYLIIDFPIVFPKISDFLNQVIIHPYYYYLFLNLLHFINSLRLINLFVI